MVNSRASSSLVLIETHEAAGAEASHTFSGAWTPDQYSKLIIICQYEPTATFSLELVVNALEGTLNHTAAVMSNIATEGTSNSSADADAWLIGDGNADVSCIAEIEIYVNDIGALDISGFSKQSQKNQFHIANHSTDATASSITSLKLQTTTSTWKTGSKFTLYGLKR